MPTLSPAPPTASEIVRLIPGGGPVLAVTDDGEDPRYAPVRDAAAMIALASKGRVVLYCARAADPSPGAAGSRLFVPDSDQAGVAPRLHTGARRRDLLRRETAEIRARSVDVAIWLAGRSGPAALAEAVTSTGAAVVLVPAEAQRPRVIERVIRRTLSYYASRVEVPIVAVTLEGRFSVISPLGSRGGDPGREVRHVIESKDALLHAPRATRHQDVQRPS